MLFLLPINKCLPIEDVTAFLMVIVVHTWVPEKNFAVCHFEINHPQNRQDQLFGSIMNAAAYRTHIVLCKLFTVKWTLMYNINGQ